MISSIADKVVNGYIQEACAILDYDIAYVRVIYVPQIDPIAGIPQHAAITADGCLIIDETWANREIANETPTRLRYEVYCKVRMLYQQTKSQTDFNQYAKGAIDDAMAYNNALMALKGLILPMPPFPQIVESLLKRTQKLLKEELGINAEYYLMPKELVKADNVWKFKFTVDDEKKYANRYFSKPQTSTVRIIDSTEKGTETNPFDNANEAFEYIKRLESDAYANDPLLKDIASQQYFYDLNFHQFRVPWASPYVAFYNDSNIPSDGFIVNQNQVHPDGTFHFTLKPNLQGNKQSPISWMI